LKRKLLCYVISLMQYPDLESRSLTGGVRPCTDTPIMTALLCFHNLLVWQLPLMTSWSIGYSMQFQMKVEPSITRLCAGESKTGDFLAFPFGLPMSIFSGIQDGDAGRKPMVRTHI